MKTLQEIKEEYAIYHAYCDWNELIYSNDDPDYIDKCNDEVSKIHAKEAAKQALINASENVRLSATEYELKKFKGTIDKQSILNESNIPEL